MLFMHGKKYNNAGLTPSSKLTAKR